MRAATRTLAGAEVLVCGTGYTGEDGVELLCAPEDAPALWDELLRGRRHPGGLGARDTLRLEACFPLYGNELTLERGPIEAGLGWACKEPTGFIGAEAVADARAQPAAAEAGRVRRGRAGDRPRRATRSRAAARSPAARSRRACGRGSAWPTCRTSAPATATRLRDRRPWQDARRRRQAQAALQKGSKPQWRRPAIQRSCSTTPSTTGRASTRPEWRRSASPGTPRTRSARSSSSTRPRSARRSPRTPPTPRSSRSRPSPT